MKHSFLTLIRTPLDWIIIAFALAFVTVGWLMMQGLDFVFEKIQKIEDDNCDDPLL